MSKNNLTVIPGGGAPSITKEALRKMKEDLPMTLEFISIHAELTRAKFNELVKQGFTEAQALELSRSLI